MRYSQETSQWSGRGPHGEDASPSDACMTEEVTAALRQHFPSREALLEEARHQTALQKRRRGRVAVIAAICLPVCAAAALLWQDPVWQVETLQTAVGEQHRYTLPDGSLVVLNTNSVLRMERRLRTRSLVLEQGEASFTVAADWRPFIVRSGAAWVRDISTEFNILRYQDRSQVTVLEGAVEVARLEPGDGHTGPRQMLLARQQLSMPDHAPQDGALPRIEEADLAVSRAWQQGRLVFDGTPLVEVADEIRRYRTAPVEVADGLGALRLSGVYDIRDMDALLAALPRALPVRLQRHADGRVSIVPRAGGRPAGTTK